MAKGFRAAVLFPNDLGISTLADLHRMRIPTLLPGPEWQYRLQRKMPWSWQNFGAAIPAEVREAWDLDRKRRALFRGFSKWWDSDQASLNEVLFWHKHSTAQAYPELPRFGGVGLHMCQPRP